MVSKDTKINVQGTLPNPRRIKSLELALKKFFKGGKRYGETLATESLAASLLAGDRGRVFPSLDVYSFSRAHRFY
jgi:hypothetical protein